MRRFKNALKYKNKEIIIDFYEKNRIEMTPRKLEIAIKKYFKIKNTIKINKKKEYFKLFRVCIP